MLNAFWQMKLSPPFIRFLHIQFEHENEINFAFLLEFQLKLSIL